MNQNRQLAQDSSKKILENKEEKELQGEMNTMGEETQRSKLHYCFSVWSRLTQRLINSHVNPGIWTVVRPLPGRTPLKTKELSQLLDYDSLQVADISLRSPIQWPYFHDVCHKEHSFEIVCAITRKWKVQQTRKCLSGNYLFMEKLFTIRSPQVDYSKPFTELLYLLISIPSKLSQL